MLEFKSAFFCSNVMFISTTMLRLILVVETSQKMEVKSTTQKDAKIQSYSLDFKISVIEHAEGHTR